MGGRGSSSSGNLTTRAHRQTIADAQQLADGYNLSTSKSGVLRGVSDGLFTMGYGSTIQKDRSTIAARKGDDTVFLKVSKNSAEGKWIVKDVTHQTVQSRIDTARAVAQSLNRRLRR